MPQRRRSPELLITDVDNTLYDFGAYFESGLRSLIRETHECLGIDIGSIIDGLREVYGRYGSIEYPFALEEFESVRRLEPSQRARVMERLSSAFWDGARRGLRPYPGVLFGLRHLQREGVDVVAFTDAPIHEAVRRLRAIGADRYLNGIIATDWFKQRNAGTAGLPLADVPGFIRVPRRMSVVGRLVGDERKPNPGTYTAIMRAFGVTADHVTVIGDSPARDLQPAAAVGMRAVWARYGRRNPAAEPLLQQVVPFKLPEIKAPQDRAAAAFPAVDRFDQVLEYLDMQPSQPVLPMAAG